MVDEMCPTETRDSAPENHEADNAKLKIDSYTAGESV